MLGIHSLIKCIPAFTKLPVQVERNQEIVEEVVEKLCRKEKLPLLRG